jgi:hypothetical protein
MAAVNGEAWLSGLGTAEGIKNEDLEYKVNDRVRTLHPVSVYKAADNSIKRGHLVSIDIGGVAAHDDYIVKTDTSIHKKSIGVALATASAEGDLIPVLSLGLFYYSEVYAGSQDLYFLSPPAGQTTITNANAKGNILYAGPTAGTVTFSRQEAALNGRNIIEIGQVTSVNTDSVTTPPGTYKIVGVEISMEGDGRGPIGITQLEYNLGEDVLLYSNDHKVFALGKESTDRVFKYQITFRKIADYTTLADKWFIIRSRVKGVGFYFYDTTDGGEPIALVNRMNALFPPTDHGDKFTYIGINVGVATITGFYQSSVSRPWFTSGASYICNAIRNAIIANVSGFLSANSSANVMDVYSQPTEGADGGDAYLPVIFYMTTAAAGSAEVKGGPIEIEFSTGLHGADAGYLIEDSLDGTDMTYSIQKGNYVTAGKAVLADRTDVNKIDIVGLLVSTDLESKLDYNTVAFFQKQGIIDDFAASTFTAGDRLFLDSEGNLTANFTSYNVSPFDYIVEIGHAKDDQTLDIYIGQNLTSRERDLPIGAIDRLPVGISTENYGYLPADGSEVSQTTYADLYAVYGTQFNTGGETAGNFRLPNLNGDGGQYQIKALAYGTQPAHPLFFYKQFAGTVAGDFSAGARTFSATSLKASNSSLAPTLDNLVVKVFGKAAAYNSGQYFEIFAGVGNNGTRNYGFLLEDVSNIGSLIYEFKITYAGADFSVRKSDGTLIAIEDYKVVAALPEQFIYYRDNDSFVLSALRYFDGAPQVPYKPGDIWKDGSAYKVCQVPKTSSQAFDAADWDTLSISNDVVSAFLKSDEAAGDLTMTYTDATDKFKFEVKDDSHNHTNSTLPAKTAADATAGFIIYVGTGAPVAGQFDSNGTPGTDATKRLNYNGDFYCSHIGVTSTVQADGLFDKGTTNPVHTTRKNFDGNLYVTNLYAVTALFIKYTTGPYWGSLAGATLTASRTWTHPDADGTVLIAQAAQAAGYFDTNTVAPSHTNRLNWDGYFYATALYSTSTLKAKENVKPFRKSGLDIVNDTAIFSYTLKDDESKETKLGWIAEITNELIAGKSHDKADIYNAISVLFKAVQELYSLVKGE